MRRVRRLQWLLIRVDWSPPCWMEFQLATPARSLLSAGKKEGKISETVVGLCYTKLVAVNSLASLSQFRRSRKSVGYCLPRSLMLVRWSFKCAFYRGRNRVVDRAEMTSIHRIHKY